MTGPKRWLLSVYKLLPAPAPRIAVLIDGDNVSAKNVLVVLRYLSSMGRVCVKRVYGNLTGKAAASWTEITRDNGAVSRHMSSVAPGKNAADIALTIDAMDILRTRRVDIFALISSDADLAPLAWRLREEGKEILGFGYHMTPKAFRLACDKFREIATLAGSLPPDTLPTTPRRQDPVAATPYLLPLLRLHLGPNGVSYKQFAQIVRRRYRKFDARIFRRRSLYQILLEIPQIELVEREGERFVRLTGESELDDALGSEKGADQ